MSTDLWPGAATTEPADAPDAAGTPPDAALGRGGPLGVAWRRHWRWIAIVGALVVVAILLVWSGPPARSGAAYHPDNPTFNGSQALARVLADHGVEVVVAEGEAALRRANVDGETTVLVTNTSDLRDPTTQTLVGIAGSARRLVLVRPDRPVLRRIAPTVGMRDTARQGAALVSTCSTADVRVGETITRSQSEFQDARATGACFTTDDYSVYLLTTGRGIGELVLLGSTDLVTNDRIGQADNGAVVLRSLGHSARVVWYVPDLRDVPPSAAGRQESFTPPWWGSMLLLGAFAIGAVFWWRGRRFGRLVAEPLPVVVRALETTESRARMYQRARDGARAAAVLREATRRRLTAYLGLPAGTAPEILAEATATATGRPLAEVSWLLAGPPVSSDADMLGLAATLAALEKEIRRT